jgi:putative ABC transport system substrate-binding protein
MTRRQVLIALGTAASLAPLASFAEAPSKVRRIGFLTPRANPDLFYEAFTQGMRELGYVEGTNVAIEARYADGKYERLPALAAELVRMNVEIIVVYGTAAAKALQHATRSIPIVAAAAVDLVGSGIVASLARPGANITGLSAIGVDLSPKHLELLRTMIPRVSRVAVLVNPGNTANAAVLQNVQAAARPAGIKVLPVEARTAEEMERGFTTSARDHARRTARALGLTVPPDLLLRADEVIG